MNFTTIHNSHIPTRICFVAPNIYPVLAGALNISIIGGAEFRQSMLARVLTAGNYEVSVITQDYGQSENELIDGIRIFKTHAPQGGIPILRYIYPRLSSVIHCLHKANADIYYQSCASHLTGVVAWYCQRRHARSVYGGASETDFMYGQERVKYARDRRLYRWGLRHVDAIVTQTERQAALVRQHYQREARIIPNLYKRPMRKRSQCAELILWVGGIRQVKRPDRFIALARTLPQYHFRMIGGAVGNNSKAINYYESIRTQAAAVENLEFLGFVPVDETESHFDEARVLINTSEHEGFPNTFLQAWSRGIPVVSYFDTGVGKDGIRPFLFVTNKKEAAAGLVNLLADDRAWCNMSKACRSYFYERFTPSKVVKDYADLFCNLGIPMTRSTKVQD